VRHQFVQAGVLAVLAAVPLLVVLAVLPGDRSRALDIYVVYLGALLLLVLARTTAGEREARSRSLLDPRDDDKPQDDRIAELDRLERDVVLATGSELDQHVRINPLLRDVVEHRLWTSRGIELEKDPERARTILGAELYELVKPGRPDPNARYFKGLDLPALSSVLDRIEAI